MTKTKPRSVKRMTAAEFIRGYSASPGVELIEGKLKRLPMTGADHGGIEVNIVTMLNLHAKEHNLGRVFGGEVSIRTGPATFRTADVLFVSYETLPKKLPRPKGHLDFAPDLVVEIRSPSDRYKAVRKKIEDYLSAGVKVVMVVDPETESVGVFRDDELPIRFHNGDSVVIPDLLPKFQVPVKAFFE